MTKQDFLETLRCTLNGNMASSTVDEHIRFYDGYFIAEAAKGRSEADVLNSLGDPRILARTLIDAAGRAGDPYAQGNGEAQYRNSAYQDTDTNPSHDSAGFRLKKIQMPGWLIAILVIAAVVIVIQIVGSIFFALLPYLIPIIIVAYVVRLIRRG